MATRRLHLTPDILRAQYELLRVTPPFRGWKMPQGDTVEFHVTNHQDRFGDCYWKDSKQQVIRISNRKVHTLFTLNRVMAHEMAHVEGQRRGDIGHGKIWQRLADRICHYHSFDRGEF